MSRHLLYLCFAAVWPLCCLAASLHSSHHHSLPRCKHHPAGCDTDEGCPPPLIPRKLTTIGDCMCYQICVWEREREVTFFYTSIVYPSTFLHIKLLKEDKQLHPACINFFSGYCFICMGARQNKKKSLLKSWKIMNRKRNALCQQFGLVL